MTEHLYNILAVRCSDTNYSDFLKSFHQEALKYANRKIARKYSLLTRYYSFKCIAENEQAALKPVKLKLHSFSEEIKILINDAEYDRGTSGKLDTEKNQYELYWGTDSYLFNYTNRSLEDVIQMTYMAEIGIDDFDDKSVTPIIPEKYDDEVLRYALIYEIGRASCRERV